MANGDEYGVKKEGEPGKGNKFMKRRIWMGIALLLVAALLWGERYHTVLYRETLSQNRDALAKVAYLTFDDGPSVLTEQYLDILDRHQVKATFFLIGQQIEGEMKDIVRREIKEGHEIGIHTFTHESGEIYQSADAYYRDVCRVRDLLQEEFQYTPTLWRFPWGSANCYICNYKTEIVDRLREEKLEYVDWNVSGEDSVGYPTCSSIIQNIRKDCFQMEEPVILMHDSGSNQATLDSLETVITMLEEAGYHFATVSERKKYCHFGEYN